MLRRALSTIGSTTARGEAVAMPKGLTVRTPLLESAPLSAIANTRVLLKLETAQPSGSFKDRGTSAHCLGSRRALFDWLTVYSLALISLSAGMAYMCATLKAQGATSLICSSGGNAGHAVAAMGRRLGMRVRVIVPTTTKQIMLDKIASQGAEVTVHGENWNAADELARELVGADSNAEYIPPYEHELLWEGHSSLVDEVLEAGERPGAIVASVGGGGLLNGVYLGLRRHGLNTTRVVSAETNGANCFAAAASKGFVPTRLKNKKR